VSGIVYAILGMIAGVMFLRYSLTMAVVGGRVEASSTQCLGSELCSSCLLRMVSWGFVLSLILAALYNVVAMFVGGIEIQTDQER